MFIGSGNNEFRFLFLRPGIQVKEVREWDGRGRSGVVGVDIDIRPGGTSSLDFDCSAFFGKGSALLELAFGPSKFNICPLPRLPANFLNSSRGSFPGLRVPNLDFRFSTLWTRSSLPFRWCSGELATLLLDFCRENGRNLDRLRSKGGRSSSSNSPVGAVVIIAGAATSQYQTSATIVIGGQTHSLASQEPAA